MFSSDMSYMKAAAACPGAAWTILILDCVRMCPQVVPVNDDSFAACLSRKACARSAVGALVCFISYFRLLARPFSTFSAALNRGRLVTKKWRSRKAILTQKNFGEGVEDSDFMWYSCPMNSFKET